MPNDKRPPKKWFSEKLKEVKEGNPSYSDEQAKATVGHIWWEVMDEADRKKVRGSSSLRISARDVLKG